MTFWQRLARRAATLLPQPIVEAPERVLINVVCVLIGVAVLLADQTPLWPRQVAVVWSLIMIGGGACAIVGYWNSRSGWAGSLERVGYLAILTASAAYAVQSLAVWGWRAVPIAAVFAMIAAAKTIRLLVSSTVRAYVIAAGRDETDPEGPVQ